MNEKPSAQVHWIELPGLPGSGTIWQFHRKDQSIFREGLVLQLSKDEQIWIGNFQKGDGDYSNILSFPEENTILVVAGGLGYKVPIGNPESYTILSIYPIRYGYFSEEKRLLILATYTDIFAYSPTGMLWKTDRFVLDDLEIINISQKYLIGRGWHPSMGGNFEFRFELDTGYYEIN